MNNFEHSVFINCPFDDAYYHLLRPIIFCILDLGFQPRISSESLDSGQSRIDKIMKLIEEYKFSIHDISRIKASERDELYRMNMPFELGLDMGCKKYGKTEFNDKKILILETEPHRYKAAISDLSSSDITAHNDDPIKALTAVRNWLVSETYVSKKGPAYFWARFNDFMAYNYDDLKCRGYSDEDIKTIPMPELIACMRDWISLNKI